MRGGKAAKRASERKRARAFRSFARRRAEMMTSERRQSSAAPFLLFFPNPVGRALRKSPSPPPHKKRRKKNSHGDGVVPGEKRSMTAGSASATDKRPTSAARLTNCFFVFSFLEMKIAAKLVREGKIRRGDGASEGRETRRAEEPWPARKKKRTRELGFFSFSLPSRRQNKDIIFAP